MASTKSRNWMSQTIIMYHKLRRVAFYLGLIRFNIGIDDDTEVNHFWILDLPHRSTYRSRFHTLLIVNSFHRVFLKMSVFISLFQIFTLKTLWSSCHFAIANSLIAFEHIEIYLLGVDHGLCTWFVEGVCAPVPVYMWNLLYLLFKYIALGYL